MSVVTKFPTANAAYSAGGFTDPNNLHADDGAYGTSIPAKNNGKGNAYSGFGFDGDIPSGSTINSVKIIYEFKVSATNYVAVQRVKARIATVEEENHDNTNEPLTDTIVTVDITADRAWARDNLLDANFEAIAEPRRGNSNTAYTASWDYIKVEVDYTAPSGITVEPSPAVSIGSALLGAVLLGSLLFSPVAVSSVAAKVDPFVVLGSLTIAPTPSEAVARSINPTVEISGGPIVPEPATAV